MGAGGGLCRLGAEVRHAFDVELAAVRDDDLPVIAQGLLDGHEAGHITAPAPGGELRCPVPEYPMQTDPYESEKGDSAERNRRIDQKQNHCEQKKQRDFAGSHRRLPENDGDGRVAARVERHRRLLGGTSLHEGEWSLEQFRRQPCRHHRLAAGQKPKDAGYQHWTQHALDEQQDDAEAREDRNQCCCRQVPQPKRRDGVNDDLRWGVAADDRHPDRANRAEKGNAGQIQHRGGHLGQNGQTQQSPVATVQQTQRGADCLGQGHASNPLNNG